MDSVPLSILGYLDGVNNYYFASTAVSFIGCVFLAFGL